MIKLYTTSLRSKILLGFTVILLIMFFATLWSIYNFYRLNEQIKLTMQENYLSIIAVDNMGKALDEQLQAIVIIYNQNFEEGEKLFEQKKEDFYYWFNKAYERANESPFKTSEKNILDTLNQEYLNFVKEKENIDYTIYVRSKQPTLRSDYVRFVNQIQSIKKRNNAILELNHNSLNRAVSQTNDITKSATITILIILFGAIAISLTFSTRFSDFIVMPITKLRETVTHIADGNFDEHIEIDENADEISSLGEEINKMSDKLMMYEQLNLNKIIYEKKKSELIIESMNEPVLMVDENYDVMLSNKAFNEVFNENLLTKLDIKKILGPKQTDAEDKISLSKDLYQKEDIINIKYSTGEQKYFKLISSSLAIPESETKGTVIVFNDITKYKELDRMKSEFMAKVSHELKTPLTSIGMALGIFEDGIVGKLSDHQNELILSMKEDFERLNRLVYEILELTKLEANAGKNKFEKFEAQKLAEHISKKFSIQAKEKNIKLDVTDKSSGLMINGNYDAMISALENMVSNSIRFTPNNGDIGVKLSKEDNKLVVEISDTGIGISPDNLKKIFDKFMQIDDSSPGSLGLGLSIAKEIIEIHGGEIKAFSELGKGSTFQIKLPAA